MAPVPTSPKAPTSDQRCTWLGEQRPPLPSLLLTPDTSYPSRSSPKHSKVKHETAVLHLYFITRVDGKMEVVLQCQGNRTLVSLLTCWSNEPSYESFISMRWLPTSCEKEMRREGNCPEEIWLPSHF